MKNWTVWNKKADFAAIAAGFGIDPVTARLLRNRDIIGEEAIRLYLEGGIGDLCDAHLLKDGDRLASILSACIDRGEKIRVIGDYDIDGVMSTHILVTAVARCGGNVTAAIPDRITDGYGLNQSLIERAHADGVQTILTCDNGISAIGEIAYAKSLGMTVLITDHHQPPYEETGEGKRELESEADAVVNPHQESCPYPEKELCGAGVAWKIVCLLYGLRGIPAQEAEDFLEFVAFATVGDIMELTGENRILVREGLKRIHRTKNPGMQALIVRCGCTPEQIDAYHFGFVLGPCINASGRLDTAERALTLFSVTDRAQALGIAEELVVLNTERKELTERGVEEAIRLYEREDMQQEPVIVLYLPEVHESIAGIIAGRIRERYYKPAFILTRTEGGVKGSGRSVEEYSMYERMCECRELFTKFGGHPMAAGLSLPEENVGPFRERINALCPPECRNLTARVRIDVPMPMDYVSPELVREFALLAPFGKGNPRPVFADKQLRIRRMWYVGKSLNVLRLNLLTASGVTVSGICFREAHAFETYLVQRFGEAEVEAARRGQENAIRIAVVYQPTINTFHGQESLQFEIRDYR